MPGSSGLPGPAGGGRGSSTPTNSRQTQNATASGTGSAAPPLASAAPGGTTKYNYVGLVDAMNAREQELVNNGSVEYPNVYEVKFVPESLAASKIVAIGTTDYSKTPDQQAQTAKAKLDPKTNSMNTQGKNLAVSQGTQIVQFIEMTVRNSRYITDQLRVAQDQVTGNSISNTSTAAGNTTTWFKVLVNAVPIGDKVDSKRHDYPYRITYIVSSYAINEAQSQYFPQAQFRGVQKLYNYWFTGENTQVISYEQKYNSQFYNVLSSKTATVGAEGRQTDPLFSSVGYGIGPNKNVPAPRSGQSDQQAQNGANNPASTLADYLYSFADQDEVSIRIIGDPSWLVQGEVKGISSEIFSFSGFYPDGSVNTDNQQVVFAINWNAPADYNNGPSGPYSGSGLMDINADATNGNSNNLSKTPAQASAAYTATEVKSYFSKGKFEQELKGNILKNLSQKQIADATRPTNVTDTAVKGIAQAVGRVGLLQQAETAISGLIKQYNPFNKPTTNTAPTTAPNSASPISNSTPQGASPAGAPTSEGVVVGAANPNPTSPPVALAPLRAVPTTDSPIKSTATQTMAAKDS